MGIYNRDYLREPTGYQAPPPAAGRSAIKTIVFITVGVFVLQLLSRGVVTEWCAVSFEEILFQGQVWRLVTYAFCHDVYSLWHILFNMYLLWILGREIEAMYGSREVTLFYLVSAVIAALCYLLIRAILGQQMPMIGASGAVTAIMMLFTLHYPRRQLYLFGLIPVEMRWLMGLKIVIDLHPLLLELGGESAQTHVAHSAHLGGALFAWFYFRRQVRLESFWLRLFGQRSGPAFGRRRQLKIFQPPPPSDDMDNDVDRILAKISEQGEESLTKRERETLKQASRRLRSKRPD